MVGTYQTHLVFANATNGMISITHYHVRRVDYVSMRHNEVRDLEAELTREVCNNVQTEHALLPINNINTIHGASTNIKDNARLDVSGIGVWGAHERTFLDIRILHPNCPTYRNKPIEKVYEEHEKQKKREYVERVLHVEKGSFVPIVGSTFGGMGKEANRFHKRIANLVADKKKESIFGRNKSY